MDMSGPRLCSTWQVLHFRDVAGLHLDRAIIAIQFDGELASACHQGPQDSNLAVQLFILQAMQFHLVSSSKHHRLLRAWLWLRIVRIVLLQWLLEAKRPLLFCLLFDGCEVPSVVLTKSSDHRISSSKVLVPTSQCSSLLFGELVESKVQFVRLFGLQREHC
eukprot:Skav236055  [mRNA]  locus=scaffold2566:88391:98335:- [translate_table: standard]